MKYLSAILLFVLAMPMIVWAQQAPSREAKVYSEVIAGSSSAVVKGEPYAAEAVSESVQILADGNKISRSNTTKMFRDSEGRTRREGNSSNGVGGFTTAVATAPAATAPGSDFFTFSGFGFQETISIFDPVSNVRYSLNPTAKTARRSKAHFGLVDGAFFGTAQSMTPAIRAQVETYSANAATARAVTANAARDSHIVVLPGLSAVSIGGNGTSRAGKTESLGTRDIEGVQAEGTRSITTIPAGAIGNERPIEIVYERWYSKELQLMVYSRHTDPRFGEQIYRLTNISRSEPDRSLFAPPADYKIVSESSVNYFTTKPREEK
jgi:hypothetical protein